jgi:hypothetical protein
MRVHGTVELARGDNGLLAKPNRDTVIAAPDVGDHITWVEELRRRLSKVW